MSGTDDTPITALLIEDDLRLATLTAEYLQGHGVIVTHLSDGARAADEARRGRYDVVLLDLMLPGLDGMEVCRRLRSCSDVPIIMLTARGEEADRVMGLETGADDYLVKPYSPRELLARIRSLLRRAHGRAGPATQSLRVDRLRLDPATRRAHLGDQDLELTGYEFSLLYALAQRAGRVLSREQLMEMAAGSSADAFDRSVDVHVSRLRNKLGDDARHPRIIRTVRGLGYLLAEEWS